jgi:sulfofructose kinase
LPELERRGEDREPTESYDVKAMGHESISDTVFDVVGIGASSIDELLWVARYPEADSKVPVLRRARRCGGLGATSLVAAAQLGSRAAFAGILDTDEYSQFVIEALAAKGVHVQHVHVYPGAMPVLSVILLDENQKTRTILYDAGGLVGPEDDWLPTELIVNARVLLVDHLRVDLMIRAARAARDAGTAVVGDIEDAAAPRVTELVEVVDHLVVSSSFAAAFTGVQDPALAAQRLAGPRRSVVVTCGADGSWYLPEDGSQDPVHQPAFPVDVVDTNGCGDVFHGAYASALARGVTLPDRVRFASAAAAISAITPGGQEGIPDTETVTRYLEAQT